MSADPESARQLAAQIGPAAFIAADNGDALQSADAVVLALRFTVLKGVLDEISDALTDKLVVVPSNPLTADAQGNVSRVLPAGQSSGQVVAGWLPKGARVAMAFGTMSAGLLESSANRSPEQAVLFYVTDDDRAGEQVERLIRTAGFDAVEVGGLEQTDRLEVGGDLHDLVVGPAEAQSLVSAGERNEERKSMREDIVVGATFPDYQLEDQAGVLRKLSELQGANPLVLHLSRGSYDPKEHRFLKNLVDRYPEFRVAYTRLVVISTDSPLNLNEFRDSVGALWPFLGDPERTVQHDLDIDEFTDPHNPMIPHTFVLEPGLRIFSIYNGYWYWGRPTMDELHVDLRAVLRKVRPDFDLGAPGLREAWDRGDREMFLVDTLDPPIRYTEGGSVGIKRGGL